MHSVVEKLTTVSNVSKLKPGLGSSSTKSFKKFSSLVNGFTP